MRVRVLRRSSVPHGGQVWIHAGPEQTRIWVLDSLVTDAGARALQGALAADPDLTLRTVLGAFAVALSCQDGALVR